MSHSHTSSAPSSSPPSPCWRWRSRPPPPPPTAPAPSSSPSPGPTEGVEEGGLFAVRDGQQNQLTENPADTEPSFSPDGRTIAFAREGHIYTVRPDGSGERRLTNGSALDSRPQISPNGRSSLFERRTAEGEPAHLYTVRGRRRPGEGPDPRPRRRRPKRASPPTARRSSSSAPPPAGNRANADLYSIRPNGTGLTRLTTTGRVDEFDPRYFAGGIVFSRGNQSEGAGRLRRHLHDEGERHESEAAGRRRRLGLRRRRLAAGPHADLPPRPRPLGEEDRPRQGEEGRRTARRLADQLGLLLRRQQRRDDDRRATANSS